MFLFLYMVEEIEGVPSFRLQKQTVTVVASSKGQVEMQEEWPEGIVTLIGIADPKFVEGDVVAQFEESV